MIYWVAGCSRCERDKCPNPTWGPKGPASEHEEEKKTEKCEQVSRRLEIVGFETIRFEIMRLESARFEIIKFDIIKFEIIAFDIIKFRYY